MVVCSEKGVLRRTPAGRQPRIKLMYELQSRDAVCLMAPVYRLRPSPANNLQQLFAPLLFPRRRVPHPLRANILSISLSLSLLHVRGISFIRIIVFLSSPRDEWLVIFKLGSSFLGFVIFVSSNIIFSISGLLYLDICIIILGYL